MDNHSADPGKSLFHATALGYLGRYSRDAGGTVKLPPEVSDQIEPRIQEVIPRIKNGLLGREFVHAVGELGLSRVVLPLSVNVAPDGEMSRMDGTIINALNNCFTKSVISELSYKDKISLNAAYDSLLCKSPVIVGKKGPERVALIKALVGIEIRAEGVRRPLDKSALSLFLTTEGEVLKTLAASFALMELVPFENIDEVWHWRPGQKSDPDYVQDWRKRIELAAGRTIETLELNDYFQSTRCSWRLEADIRMAREYTKGILIKKGFNFE